MYVFLSSVFVFDLVFHSQEVKALREETAQEENRYHYINSMSEVRRLLKTEKKHYSH